MADADFSLILENIKSLRGELKDFRRAFDLHVADMQTVKAHQAAFMQGEAIRGAQHSDLVERVERIERRLELRDAQ